MVKMPVCGEAWLATTASSADTSCISTALHAQEEPSSQQSCSQSPAHCQHARPKLPISPRLTIRRLKGRDPLRSFGKGGKKRKGGKNNPENRSKRGGKN